MELVHMDEEAAAQSGAAVAEKPTSAGSETGEQPGADKPSTGDGWLRTIAGRAREMPEYREAFERAETKKSESDSTKPETQAQPPKQEQQPPKLIDKPLSAMTADEFRSAIKEKPELYRAWQSEADKARDEGRRSALPEVERQTEDAARTQAASLIAAGHDAALKIYDDGVLNGALWNAIPTELRSDPTIAGKKWGTGPDARINAAKAYVELVKRGAFEAGKLARDEELSKDPLFRDTIAKRLGAADRDRQVESGDLPNATRGSAAPPPGESTNFTQLIRRRALGG